MSNAYKSSFSGSLWLLERGSNLCRLGSRFVGGTDLWWVSMPRSSVLFMDGSRRMQCWVDFSPRIAVILLI